MPESWSENLDDDLDLHTITPVRARQDHWNEAGGLTIIITNGMNDEQYRVTLARYQVTRMRSFTERFPPDRYPGVIEGQPAGTVERFDQIAAEVTALIQSDQMTIQKARELVIEMRLLCYQ